MTGVRRAGRQRGFALVIVLLVITVLGVLAGSFAYSMKVETRLAYNSSSQTDLEWLGRSGVEMAKYVVDQSKLPYSSLNQLWAGGPGAPEETNSVLAGLSLRDVPLGDGFVTVTIRDLERKMNINTANEPLLTQALTVMEVGAADTPVIVDSILDWIDRDEDPHLSGTESDFYLTLSPPYRAKNGPLDDLAELLLIRGVTPELYWGADSGAHQSQLFRPNATARAGEQPTYAVGLADLFTPLSSGRINLNTASARVLQLIPGVSMIIANNIVQARSGPDGIEGTEDDTPFRSPGAINPATIPGLDPQNRALTTFGTTVSTTFEAVIDVRLGEHRKRFNAILRKPAPNEGQARNLRSRPATIEVLQFSWL